jgi:hypothetical protein
MVNIEFEIYRMNWRAGGPIEEQLRSAIQRANTVRLLSTYYHVRSVADTFEHLQTPHESEKITLDLNSVEEFIAAASMLIAMIKAKEIEDVNINNMSIASYTIDQLRDKAVQLGLIYMPHSF